MLPENCKVYVSVYVDIQYILEVTYIQLNYRSLKITREKSAVIYWKLPNKTFKRAYGPFTDVEIKCTLTFL